MADTNCVLIAAIDFGTTYSGYAFQLTSEYDSKDPTRKILSPQSWNDGQTKLTSMKTPTCLLLDSNQNIKAFGYTAEEKYADICMESDTDNWYFFRRFKMQLYKEKVTSSTMITDEADKPLPALTVFSKSIECLKNHLNELLEKKNIHVLPTEIKWMLTVPAIWDDVAKEFMRKAAKKAGISREHLTIALEPEAASLFCQYLPVEKFSVGGQSGFSDASPGTTYMIVDLGGGTADMTVHEKVSHGKLKEIHRASGGVWGGTSVDGAFINLLSSIVGGPVFHTFMKEEKYDYLDMMRDFESVKRNVSLTTTEAVKMKIPASLNDTCLKVVKKDFKTLVKMAKKDKQITFVGDKAKFEPILMQSLFKKATDKIVAHMKSILNSTPAGKKVSLILMVGGFSESAFVQDVIKSEFHEKNGRRVLIPKDAGISVVQGAVVFGRNPGNITCRVLRYTYGTRLNNVFEHGKHDPAKLNVVDGVERCNDIFGKFCSMGTEVEPGHVVKQGYKTTDPTATTCNFAVFASTDDDTTYTDEQSCTHIGELTVQIPNPNNTIRDIEVEYIFGDTELHLKAIDKLSGKPVKAKLKMIE